MSVPAIPTPASKYLNSLFPRCTTLRLLRQLHARILLHGLHLSAFFGSRLATSYYACASLLDARQAFDQISAKNPRFWNTMLAGCSRTQSFVELLQLYRLLREENNRPDSFSLVFAVWACTRLSLLKEGKLIRCEAIKSGQESDDHAAPSLLNVYIELGSVDEAEKVFDRAPIENSAVWGLKMKGYLEASIDNNGITFCSCGFSFFCKGFHCL